MRLCSILLYFLFILPLALFVCLSFKDDLFSSLVFVSTALKLTTIAVSVIVPLLAGGCSGSLIKTSKRKEVDTWPDGDWFYPAAV